MAPKKILQDTYIRTILEYLVLIYVTDLCYCIQYIYICNRQVAFKGESLREEVAKRLVVRYMKNFFEIILLRSVEANGISLALRSPNAPPKFLKLLVMSFILNGTILGLYVKCMERLI